MPGVTTQILKHATSTTLGRLEKHKGQDNPGLEHPAQGLCNWSRGSPRRGL